ncbi:uncharacterized protein L3040_005034 [Drepanopeziza brunnea f. sp. 'multigermtubi']|uniref:uncharacterized protein n=1 Tax=Drepanopeziza brunnea f. sp. 'multigermtubi' TaxID=698441 RepID=UPI00239D7132|nr:hypothetical protein L3040_005034 [Drepanopeziza brunnea f. sp. 'multigermtubi']
MQVVGGGGAEQTEPYEVTTTDEGGTKRFLEGGWYQGRWNGTAFSLVNTVYNRLEQHSADVRTIDTFEVSIFDWMLSI